MADLAACTRGPSCVICQAVAAAESVGRLPALCHHFADKAEQDMVHARERDEALLEVSRLEEIVANQNRRLSAAQRKQVK